MVYLFLLNDEISDTLRIGMNGQVAYVDQMYLPILLLIFWHQLCECDDLHLCHFLEDVSKILHLGLVQTGHYG